MEFWGVEVKSGQPLDVELGEDKVLHLSQACLGELKKEKAESVCLHINIEGKKLVLGTLHSERLPQQLFDLVFDKKFQLSHNWKNGSVYFYGYIADQPIDDDGYDQFDSDTEEEDVPLPVANGKQEAKKEVKSAEAEKKNAAKSSTAGKQKVKIVEPEKNAKPDGDDSDDSDDSDAMSEDSDSEEGNEDSSDDDDVEDSDDEDEETPKKQQSGKKRPNESAVKTPATDKKAKLSTPQKTDGKKPAVHVATPHPSKQAGKTPANKSNQKSPATEGTPSCKSCNRSFKTDSALQAHNQAKHK